MSSSSHALDRAPEPVAGVRRSPRGRRDQAEEVALVARAKRELLLRVHGHRLRREDLEDCYSQATLELLARARRDGFASRSHIANALEQRYLSRVRDRRRALAGRSPMQAALETAMPLDATARDHFDIVDVRCEVETLAILRHDLRRVRELANQLSYDQRLVLAAQLDQLDRGRFCARYGWSHEKYRKVAQRARARLRGLMEREDNPPVPPAHARRINT